MLSDDNEARRAQLKALGRLIANHFSSEEINSIYIELYPEDGESVPGNTNINKAQNLVNYCRRRGDIGKLIELLIEQRPNITQLNVFDFKDPIHESALEPQENNQELVSSPSESNLATSSTKSLPEFVNRKQELQEVCSTNSNRHFVIDAPPGYGKTKFLKKIANRYKTDPDKGPSLWLIASIDLSRDDIRTVDELLVNIASQWTSEPITNLHNLTAALSRCNTNFILLVDSCHSNATFARYIHDDLYGFISKRLQGRSIRLVFSGRNMRERSYLWPSFGYLSLSPFDETAVSEFISSYLNIKKSNDNSNDPYSHIPDILMLSGGHPEAIEALVNEVIYKLDSTVFWEDDRLGIYERCIRPLRLVDKILDSQTAFQQHDQLKEQLSAISIFRIFNTTTIKAFRDLRLVDATFIGDRLIFIQKLAKFGIAQATEETYSYSEGVRNVILAEMQITNPIGYVDLHRAAHNLYTNWINGIGLNGLPNDDQLLMFILEAIYHSLESNSLLREFDVVPLIHHYFSQTIRSIHGEEGIPALKKKLANQLLADRHIRLRLKQLNQFEQVQYYLQQLSNSEFDPA